jgi:glycosyltransferase involved in cell wall biosynthesis
MKVLMSAYACCPDWGSEPSTGWNTVREAANDHDVWVLTSTWHQPQIEAELSRQPVRSLHVEFVECPPWIAVARRGQPWVQLHYYCWQLAAYIRARTLHQQIGFDVAQHLTYGRYWMPSFLPFLPVPFVWGPVGGGESAPKAFWHDLGGYGALFEVIRESARFLGDNDPWVRAVARRSAIALATSPDTYSRMEKLGARKIEVIPNITLTDVELEKLGRVELPPPNPLRFISIGRLLHWKGFHLGIRAFAELKAADAEYWIVGDGPAQRSLAALARQLGVNDRVRFLGHVPRASVMSALAQCHALVHPSLHDSSGTVIIEAMAAGRPVICLDLGGPGTLVTTDCGFKAAGTSPNDAVVGLHAAMERLSTSNDLLRRLGSAARERAVTKFGTPFRGRQFSQIYTTVTRPPEGLAHCASTVS